MPDYTREQPKEVSLPPRLPLVGIIDERPGELGRDGKLVNGYIERTDDGELHIVKRPGLSLRYVFGEGHYGAGMFENYFFFQIAVDGGTTFKFYNTETLISSTIGGSTTPLTENRLVYATNTLSSTGGYAFVFHTRNDMKAYFQSTSTLKDIPFANEVTESFAATTTHNSPTVTTTATISLEVIPYSTLTGTNIPASSSIISITEIAGSPPTTKNIVISNNATAGGSITASVVAAGPNATGSPLTTLFNSLIPGIVDLNAAIFVANPQAQITNSDRGNPLAWNPLSLIRAYLSESSPLYIVRQLGYIFLFKEWITEVFRDAGLSPGSPLARQEGMTIEVGLWSSNTLANVDGTIFWCSLSESGRKSAWMLQGGRAREIASPAVSRVLSRSNPDNGHAFSVSGHLFYALTDPSEPYTLVYDVTSNFWSYWKALDEEYWPFVAATRWDGETLLQHRTNGNVYQLDPEVFADDHSEFTMDIFPPEFDAGVKVNKFLPRLYVIGDQQEGSALEMRFSDSNREEDAWSPWYEARLDEERPRIDDLGSFTKRAFHFRHTRPLPCRVRAVELDLMLGMS